MKTLVPVAGLTLACALNGCATQDFSHLPQRGVSLQKEECRHTRRFTGQRCQVLRDKAQIRRLLQQIGSR